MRRIFITLPVSTQTSRAATSHVLLLLLLLPTVTPLRARAAHLLVLVGHGRHLPHAVLLTIHRVVSVKLLRWMRN